MLCDNLWRRRMLAGELPARGFHKEINTLSVIWRAGGIYP
jgi:hypothetical protein